MVRFETELLVASQCEGFSAEVLSLFLEINTCERRTSESKSIFFAAERNVKCYCVVQKELHR